MPRLQETEAERCTRIIELLDELRRLQDREIGRRLAETQAAITRLDVEIQDRQELMTSVSTI